MHIFISLHFSQEVKLFGTGWWSSIDVLSLRYGVDFVSGPCCVGGACVKGAGTESPCIRGTCLCGACIGVAGVRDARVRDAGAVKRLGIHSQSSRILELKRYSPALETEVGAS